MNKKKVLALSLATLFGLMLCAFVFTDKKPSYMIIDNDKIKIEKALTNEEQIQGLSGRKNIGSSEGMLFVFSSLEKYNFWMKDMLFDLDLVWIKDNKIVDITKNAKAPLDNNNLPFYQPKEAVNYVLEVKGGVSEKNDWKIGDEVKF